MTAPPIFCVLQGATDSVGTGNWIGPISWSSALKMIRYHFNLVETALTE